MKKTTHGKGYILRASHIQTIDKMYYQPYHDHSHKVVWLKHVYPIYGCSYRTFLRYLKVDIGKVAHSAPGASAKK